MVCSISDASDSTPGLENHVGNGIRLQNPLGVPVPCTVTVILLSSFDSTFTPPEFEDALTFTFAPPEMSFFTVSVFISPFVSVLTSTFTEPPSPPMVVVLTSELDEPVSTTPPDSAVFPPVSDSASVVLFICAYANAGERAVRMMSACIVFFIPASRGGDSPSLYHEKSGANPLKRPPRLPREGVSVFAGAFFAAGFFAGFAAAAVSSVVAGVVEGIELRSAGLPHASAFILSRVEP